MKCPHCGIPTNIQPLLDEVAQATIGLKKREHSIAMRPLELMVFEDAFGKLNKAVGQYIANKAAGLENLDQ